MISLILKIGRNMQMAMPPTVTPRNTMSNGSISEVKPDNVAKAIRVTGAPIVDVSSGVESAPGVKDLSLIRKFIEAAKAAR